MSCRKLMPLNTICELEILRMALYFPSPSDFLIERVQLWVYFLPLFSKKYQLCPRTIVVARTSLYRQQSPSCYFRRITQMRLGLPSVESTNRPVPALRFPACHLQISRFLCRRCALLYKDLLRVCKVLDANWEKCCGMQRGSIVPAREVAAFMSLGPV